ncbi:DUF397 domain-containing protein [Streptomyces sp. NPDC046876]|uniref:DUF397 domain-containing protein n=1 Tax=Streptomyces sp. NPDC046876 TaxID=3155616 RepID=UPI0033CE86A7
MSTQTPTSSSASLRWRKSSHSGANSNCVEVAETADGGRAVRDSKNTARAGFACSASAWAAFLHGVADHGRD